MGGGSKPFPVNSSDSADNAFRRSLVLSNCGNSSEDGIRVGSRAFEFSWGGRMFELAWVSRISYFLFSFLVNPVIAFWSAGKLL